MDGGKPLQRLERGAPGHPLDDDGPSLLHGSRARALHADARASALLHEQPPTANRMRTMASAADLDAGIFERGEPVVVHGATSEWRAAQRWASPEALCQHYGDILFGSSGLQPLELQSYIQYSKETAADFPYYIVEREFEDERAALLEDYQAPLIFADDLADIPGTSSQPHWFLGGPRTGSLMHIDPRSTFGWNACLFGRKRWCMLAPGTDMDELGLGDTMGAEGGPYAWFVDHLSELQAAAAAGKVCMRECIQEQGELVFVPFGWHHCIVNLEVSCAIAHTLINTPALPAVWPRLRARYPAFAITLREMLQCPNGRPSLAAQLLDPVGTADVVSTQSNSLSIDWQDVSENPVEKLAADDVRVKSEFPSTEHQSQCYPERRQPRKVLFVHANWIRRLIDARPSAASVVQSSSKPSLEALWSFHEQLQAVSAAVKQQDSLVCIVNAWAETADAEAEVWRTIIAELLSVHAIVPGGTVTEGGESQWASARGASEMAVLRCSGDDEGNFAAPVAWALETCPTIGHVGIRVSRLPRHQDGGHGLRTVVTSDKYLGETLLRVPLTACLTSKDISSASRTQMPEMDSYECLKVALIELMEQSPTNPLAEYFATVFAESSLAMHMLLWKPTGSAAKRAANSVAWKRANRLRIDIEARCRDLSERLAIGVAFSRYIWASVVTWTRSFEIPGGYALCPVIDLAGHLTFGATADVRFSVEHDALELVARFTLREGDEISRCYEVEDPICDFLDVFERYGFFSTDASVHTAEILVPSDALASQDQWRRALVAEQAELGADDSFGAWWIPDEAIDACPLFAAVRATLISEGEILAAIASNSQYMEPNGSDDASAFPDERGLNKEAEEPVALSRQFKDCLDAASKPAVVLALKRPIANEQCARATMASLLRRHLEGYATEPSQDAKDLAAEDDQLSVEEEAAARLVHFEKCLLHAHIRTLERVA